MVSTVKVRATARYDGALAAIDKDLGNIKLEEDAKVPESVTASASKPHPDGY